MIKSIEGIVPLHTSSRLNSYGLIFPLCVILFQSVSYL